MPAEKRHLTTDEQRILDTALRRSTKIIAQGYSPKEIEEIKSAARESERYDIVYYLHELANNLDKDGSMPDASTALRVAADTISRGL